MAHHSSLVKKAAEIVGGQKKLAEHLGLSQQGVSYLVGKAPTISAEAAIRIDAATKGAVSKAELRPDLFPTEGKAA